MKQELKNFKIKKIILRPGVQTDVHKCIDEAISYSAANQADVEFNFNDNIILVEYSKLRDVAWSKVERLEGGSNYFDFYPASMEPESVVKALVKSHE